MSAPFSIRNFRFSSLLTILALVAVTVLLWCAHNDRFNPANWRVPPDYSGDSMEILLRMQAVTQGELIPFLPQHLARLGAPFGADWSEYPVSDKPMILLLGLMARIVGVNAAANLAVLLVHVSAALAFYACARFLRHRREWSFAGALLFGFTYQIIFRGLPHLWLAFAYSVPFAVLTCWLVGTGRRVAWRSPAAWLCLGTSAVVGVSNPYNLFFFLQLLTLALVAQFFGERRRANLQLGAACMAAAFGTFFLLQADMWLYASNEGALPVLTRNYGGTELYALKPIELFLAPSSHHLGVLADVAYRYLRWSDFRGETFSPYLGIVGIAGLAWVFVEMISQLRLRKKHLPAHCLQIGWILIYSSVGGLNSLLSLYFGLLVFRATNRFSIFISAIVLLFVVSRLARLTRGWPRAASIALAMVVAGVGLYDQIPRPQSETEVAVLRARLHSDQMLGEKLEAELPAGAMVFQLPVVDFPETRPPNNLADYEHLRLFLGTKTLRFSYGALKGHSAVHWQYDYERMEPQAMAAALEQSGFAAICIDRRGYADNGKALLDGLNAAGRPVMAESELGEFVVVRLQPVLHPRPPLARGLTFGQGWNPHETGDEERLRWTSGSACVSFFNPYDRPITALMRFRVSGVDPRHFILRVNGHEQFRASVGLDPVEVVLPRIELQPGANRFDLQTFEPSVRVSQERSRLRALALRDLGFRVLPESLPAP